MISVCTLLSVAIALRWILSAVDAGILDSSKTGTAISYMPAHSSRLKLRLTERRRKEGSGHQWSSSLSRLQPASNWLAKNHNRLSMVHEIGKIESVHIICIGQCRPHHFLSDEILDIPGFKVFAELDCRTLYSTIHRVPAIVLFHDSLHPIELEDACRLVRHKWPHARILIIRDGEGFLEDSLYDDRIRPDVSGRDLIARILFLIQTLDLWRLSAD